MRGASGTLIKNGQTERFSENNWVLFIAILRTVSSTRFVFVN